MLARNRPAVGLALRIGLWAASAACASAQQAGELRIGHQQGLLYLPLYVVQEQRLLDKHAARLGIERADLRLVNLGSASAISETLLTGNVDAVAGAAAPLLTLKDRTQGAQKVKGITSLSNANLYLNTNNTKFRALQDIGEQDRIAVSGVGFSLHAILLQMAAGQAFGEGQEHRLDPLTVSMPHPEAVVALLSGQSHITAHFATPPFQHIELRNPHIHRVLTSADILDGYSPAVIVYTTQRFYDLNRPVTEAFVAACEEAVGWIVNNPDEAAALYLRWEPQRTRPEEIRELLVNGDIMFTVAPENTLKIARFMWKLGRLKEAPQSWMDFFFPVVRGKGS